MNNAVTEDRQIKDETVLLFRAIFEELSKTPEFRKVRNSLITDTMALWAKDGFVKKKIAKFVNSSFEWDTKSANYEPETKVEDLEIWKNLGKLVTTYSKLLALRDIQEAQRTARKIEKPLKDFLENTDFGDIYEMTAGSQNRIAATHEAIHNVLGNYPSKVGILPAIKMLSINVGLKKKSLALAGATGNMSPETLVSTITAMISKLISADNAAELANQITLLLHKIGVGSEILTTAGKPALETMFVSKLSDILPLLDKEMACKATKDAKEIGCSAKNAIFQILAEDPEMLSLVLETYPDIKNSDIRSRGKKAQMIEEFAESEDGPDKIDRAISDIDFQDMGDMINAWIHTANLVHGGRPEFLTRSAASLISMINLDELEEFVGWCIPELMEPLKSVGDILMPQLIEGLASLLKPSSGVDDGRMRAAVGNLKDVLNAIGGDEI